MTPEKHSMDKSIFELLNSNTESYGWGENNKIWDEYLQGPRITEYIAPFSIESLMK